MSLNKVKFKVELHIKIELDLEIKLESKMNFNLTFVLRHIGVTGMPFCNQHWKGQFTLSFVLRLGLMNQLVLCRCDRERSSCQGEGLEIHCGLRNLLLLDLFSFNLLPFLMLDHAISTQAISFSIADSLLAAQVMCLIPKWLHAWSEIEKIQCNRKIYTNCINRMICTFWLP